MSDPMTMMIGEHGSLDAPPGSRPWSVAMKWEIQSAIDDYLKAVNNLRAEFDLFAEHKGWSQLSGLGDGRTDGLFQSLEEFCKTPYPMGLGYSLNTLNAIIAEWRCHKEAVIRHVPTARPARRRRK